VRVLGVITGRSGAMSRARWVLLTCTMLLGFLTGSALIVFQKDAAERRSFLDQVKSGSSIDIADIRGLRGSPEDLKTQAYQHTRRKLAKLKERWPGCRFVYLLGRRPDGQVFFFADSEDPEGATASLPGEPYHEASDRIRCSFDHGEPFTEGPLADRWGLWVSAIVPIVDPETNSVAAVLGADIDGWQWYKDVVAGALPYVVALFIAVCVLESSILLLVSWRIRKCKTRSRTSKNVAVSCNTMRGLIVAIGVLGVIFLGVVVWETYGWTKYLVEMSAAEKTRTLARFNRELRDYFASYVRPEFLKRLGPDEFLPEVLSTSYVARHIFEGVNEERDSYVRFTARNPRNPLNRPTPGEEWLLEYFEKNPTADSWSGKLEFFEGGQSYYVVAYARRFEESCLRCHGRPQDAPSGLIKRYGDQAGFHNRVGDVSLELMAVPMDRAMSRASQQVIYYLLGAMGVCGLFIGGVIGLVVLHRVQERRLQQELHKGREFLAATLRSIGDAVISCDCHGRIVSLNSVAEKLTGWSNEEALGVSVEDLFSIFDSRTGERLPNLVHQVISCGQALELAGHIKLMTRDGRSYDIAESCAPIRDLLGQVIGAVLVFRDVNEQYRQQDKLRESQDQLRAITDSVQDAIIMIDPDGKITFWNPAAEKIFGYTAREVMGLSVHEFLCLDEDRQRFLRSYPQFVENGEGPAVGRTLELRARRKDGQIITVELSLGAVKLQSGWHAVAVVRDITQRKWNEEQLQRYAEALEAANKSLEQFWFQAEAATRAKSAFLANMSHEIRTPMTAILGYTEILLEELQKSGASREHLEALETIQRNGNYLLKLINDILDLSKIEAGQLKVEPQSLNLPELLEDVIKLMRVRAEAKALPLVLEFAGPIPKLIHSDPVRLRQILINLVGNAIKFTEEGEVRLRVRLAGEQEQSQKLCIDVIDTGIGIERDKLEHIFEPFSQGDSSTTRKYGGTGLGLTISRRLAQCLGGDITVVSAPGKGSVFTVTIDPGPIDECVEPNQSAMIKSGAASVEAKENPSEIRLDARILLAEDAPDNQRLISFILKKAGATVTVVKDGRAAVEAAMKAWENGEPFELILMDMQMPEMDGYQATRYLRDRGYSGKIVALTAHALPEDVTKALDAGCDAYLTKPIRRETFCKSLSKILAQSAPDVGPSDSNMAAGAPDVEVDPGPMPVG